MSVPSPTEEELSLDDDQDSTPVPADKLSPAYYEEDEHYGVFDVPATSS